MAGPILCYSCSKNLGEVYPFVEQAIQHYTKKCINENKKIKNYDPSKIKINPNLIPSVGHIFDAVGVGKDRLCCRTHLLTVKRYDVVYH